MRLRTRLLCPPVAVLLTPALLFAQEPAEEAGGSLFSINVGLMVWTIAVFLLVLLVLGRFAFPAILGALEAREKGIQNALDEARARQEEAQKLLEEQRQQLADARRQAQGILADGRDAADKVRKELEAKAREESEAILTRARQEIEREKDAAVDALRRESVDLALAAASKLLHRKLDDVQDRKLIMDYVDGLKSESPGAEA